MTAEATHGEPPDIDALYRAYAPRLREMLAGYVDDAGLIEDVLQETFLRVHRSRSSFVLGHDGELDRSTWWWLVRIATRVCSTARRRTERIPELPLPAGFSAGESTADPAEAWAAREGEHLAALPERYRRMLGMKYLLGLRYEDIARIEGLGVTGVDAVLTRARLRLRQVLHDARRTEKNPS